MCKRQRPQLDSMLQLWEYEATCDATVLCLCQLIQGCMVKIAQAFDREGQLRAICGGGRYDRLLSTFGGADTPACGFGFGDAVIIEVQAKASRNVSPVSRNVRNIALHLWLVIADTRWSIGFWAAQLLKDRGLLPDLAPAVDDLIIPLDEELRPQAAMLAAKLRLAGRAVDLVLESKRLKWWVTQPLVCLSVATMSF